MEEIGFKRKDWKNKEVYKNQFNDRVEFDNVLKAVYFKDEAGRSFPVTKDVLNAVLNKMEEKNY